MVTMDTFNAPTLRSVMAMKLANTLARSHNKRANKALPMTRVTAVLNGIIRVMLHVAGFGLLTMAGFQWNIITGLIVAGVSCFALSTLMTRGNADDTNVEVSRAPDLRTGR